MATFWSEAKVEPYRQFRYLVKFSITSPGKAERAIQLHFFAMKVDKPMYKVGEYNHKFLNHQFNFPGRVTWDPVSLTMVDISDQAGEAPVQAEIFKHYVRSSGYPHEPSTNDVKAGLDGISKAAAVGALGDITIEQLAPKGAPRAPDAEGNYQTHGVGQKWTLKNAFLTDVKFGSLDYGSEDAVQIQMSVRYDYAE